MVICSVKYLDRVDACVCDVVFRAAQMPGCFHGLCVSVDLQDLPWKPTALQSVLVSFLHLLLDFHCYFWILFSQPTVQQLIKVRFSPAGS